MSATPYPSGWGAPLHPTPKPGPVAPERPRLPNGLFVWRPECDESGYWAQQLPCTPEQMEYNRRALNAPLRKDTDR